MTVEEWAKSGKIEQYVRRIGKLENKRNMEDLIQDLYLQMLDPNFKKRFESWNKCKTDEEQKAYILMTLHNQIHSSRSPYFLKYKRYIAERQLNYESMEGKEYDNYENEYVEEYDK